MNHFTLPGALLVIAIIVDIYVAQLAWGRRKEQGGSMLFCLMVCVIIWEIASFLELYTPSLEQKVIFAKLSYLGSQPTPVFYLILVFTFTNDRFSLPSRYYRYLFIIPAIAILLAFTNQYHHLIWSSITPYPGLEGLAQYHHGPGYWVFALGYSYLCMLAGTYLVIRAVLKQRYTYRLQAISLLVGTCIPWICNLLYVLNLGPFPGVDGGAIAFGLTGLVTSFAILRFRLFDISPVARDILFENMMDCLIVLDLKNRITDINAIGLEMLRLEYKQCIGLPAEQLLNGPTLELLSQDPAETHKSQVTYEGPQKQKRIFDVTVLPVIDKNQDINGRLLVARDITEERLMENKLQHANETLKEQLEQIKALQETLREQTIRDPLTSLYNRRFLDDMLALQIGQARREEKPIGLVMIDLDRFKEFNDTYGHTAGDEMVKNLAHILKTRTRQGDFACRYGGEEFMVVMPGATLSVAIRRAEEWRDIFEDTPVVYEGTQLWSTFSAGVAAFPVHACTPEALIKAADKGLYLAKNCGRNRIASIEIDALSVPQYHEVDITQ
jgi:diguanylate cyclase (GGDEF)-like protein/PAS domain S-box-containing protein